MTYRKKPLVVEAFQYDGDLMYQDGTYYVPVWAVEAYKAGTIFFQNGDAFIKTLEGDMKVDYLDYIIQGIKGELYPCKPDIFDLTYELIIDHR